ncbi:MAG TPA: creatininase family protein [Humisphaera sp.]|nr:creatininase family protein [Humisphaera sp.]
MSTTSDPLGLRIEGLTWPQAEQAIERLHTILIPVGGACKEHGLHLPLNTDWVVTEYLVGRIIERCPALALPTVSYGYYPAFLDYPGSASIAASTFGEMIADICRSFARHGAGKFYVLNTGISTLAPLEATKAALGAEGIDMAYSDMRQIAVDARKSVESQPFGTHADEIETSMMLYIAPELVRMEHAVPELAADRPGALTRDPNGPGVYSATGAWGDPTLATREKGRIVVEAIVSEIVRLVK